LYLDTFPIEELEHLMEYFNVEHSEEIDLDQCEENVNNIEQVNENENDTSHHSVQLII